MEREKGCIRCLQGEVTNLCLALAQAKVCGYQWGGMAMTIVSVVATFSLRCSTQRNCRAQAKACGYQRERIVSAIFGMRILTEKKWQVYLLKKVTEAVSVFVFLLAFFSQLLAQDKVDPRPLDSSLFSDTAVYDKDFHKRHFIRGWNYSGESKKLDSALRINYQLSGLNKLSFVPQ